MAEGPFVQLIYKKLMNLNINNVKVKAFILNNACTTEQNSAENVPFCIYLKYSGPFNYYHTCSKKITSSLLLHIDVFREN